MRFIALEYFARSPVLAFPIAALAIFMAVFVIVLLRAALTKKNHYDVIASLPLADGEAAVKEQA